MKNKILIIGFLSLIYLPVLSFPIFGNNFPNDTTEKRELATFPKITRKRDILDFPKGFDSFWSDNLPYRSVIKRSYEDANLYLFNTPTTKRVVIGQSDTSRLEDSWLFFNDESQDPLGDVRGTKTYSDKQYDNLINNMSKQTKKAKKYGANVYYFVAPNKSTIYSDKLPSSVNIVSNQSALNIFERKVAGNETINYISLMDVLFNEKNTNEVYYRSDTHWNKIGAFFGVRHILKSIYGDFNAFDKYIIDKETNNGNRDLADFINSDVSFNTKYSEVRLLCDCKYEVVKENDDKEKLYISTNKNPIINKKLLLIGDSFRENTLSYLSSVFRDVVIIHHNVYDTDIFYEKKPDIVLVESVERYLINGLNIEVL